MAGSAKRPTQNSCVRASLGTATQPQVPQPSQSSCGSCHPGLSLNTGRAPPISSFAQKKVTFFQVASWRLWRVLPLLPLTRTRQTQEYEGWGGSLGGQGYRGKGQALLGFHLSAGAPPNSLLLQMLRWAGRGGRPQETHAGGTAAEGAVAAGSEGKGWSCSRGRGKRLQPCRPQRPEMARGWVGEQVGPGKLKGSRLSCGLRIRARSQCGCSLSAPARRRREGAGSLVSGEQDGRASALERGVQPPPLPRRRKPQPRPWGLRGKMVHPQTHPCRAPER